MLITDLLSLKKIYLYPTFFILLFFLLPACSTQQVARNTVAVAKLPAKAAGAVARTAGAKVGGTVGGVIGGRIGRKLGSTIGRTAGKLATGNR